MASLRNVSNSLYKLLNNTLYTTITGQNIIKFKNIQHLTINFVDDSNNVITFNDQNQLKTYLESYYKLLHSFYNINKLTINPDKTNLLLIGKSWVKCFLFTCPLSYVQLF